LVPSIFFEWSPQDLLALVHNPFFLYDRLLKVVLGKMKFILPLKFAIGLTEADMDNNVGISAGGQTS